MDASEVDLTLGARSPRLERIFVRLYLATGRELFLTLLVRYVMRWETS